MVLPELPKAEPTMVATSTMGWWEIVSCNKGIQLVGELKEPTYLDHFGEVDLKPGEEVEEEEL